MAKTRRTQPLASTSTPTRRRPPLDTTPAKAAGTFSTAPPSAKKKLYDLDSGRCFITYQKQPKASQQTGHLVASKTKKSTMKRYGKMWNVRALNKHSAKNLVTLRSDWHLSYDHGDWAFAPSAEILQKILDFNDSSFTTPYPGYSPDDFQDYVFIPLPSLKLRYIFRQTKEFDEDEDEDDDDDDDDDTDDEVQEEEDGDEEMGEEENEEENEEESEEESEGEGEGEEAGGSDGEGKGEKEQSPDDGEMGAEEGEGAGGSDGDLDIGDGDFTAYRAPFSDFPLLKHHAHPFFVIVNAIPKLGANLLSLTPEQNTLHDLMASIAAIWSRRLNKAPAQPRTSKRRRSDDEPPDDDDDDDDGGPKRRYKRNKPTTSQATPTKRQTRASAAAPNVGKGKAKQTRANKERSRARSNRQSLYPTPRTSRSPAIDKKISLFDDVSEVSAWVDAVADAGPPEKADQIVVWSDNEDVRAPIRDWNNWRVSYKQPAERARFCSSDWVMYLYSIPLWLPSYPYQKQ